MKYSNINPPIECMMTQSTCYQSTYNMSVKGILWHSTGANNPNLARYVQPDDDAPNKEELLKLIGKNRYKNDWNHIYRQAGLNAWIGKLANGTITTIQTMPWTFRPWGCGTGRYGSCNDGWIQFEICEDGLNDIKYFNQVYKEACELTAFLCKKFSINPKGSVILNGIRIPTILCHADSYRYGLGSNHGDVLHWFPRFGKNMDTIRDDVEALMGGIVIPVNPSYPSNIKEDNEIEVGDLVSLAPDSLYWNGKPIQAWIKEKKWYVYQVGSNGRAVLNEDESHQLRIMSPINVKYLIKDDAAAEPVESIKPANEVKVFTPYLIRVAAGLLNYREEPSLNSKILGTITNGGVYTIISEQKDSDGNSWGQLKGNSAWIMLKYVSKYSR